MELKRKKGKVLLDLETLGKYRIRKWHLLVPLLLVIALLISKKYFLYGAITLLSAVFSFYHDKYNRSPIDMKMPLFLGIFIARYYGLGLAIVFFVVSDLLPSLIAGGQIEGASILFIGWHWMMYVIVQFFPTLNIITLGIILVLVEAGGSLVIKSMFGFPLAVTLLTSALSVLVRIIYFLTLGNILVLILG